MADVRTQALDHTSYQRERGLQARFKYFGTVGVLYAIYELKLGTLTSLLPNHNR